jgi:hypothetical protein
MICNQWDGAKATSVDETKKFERTELSLGNEGILFMEQC